MGDLLVRFLVGGAVISAFAALGDVFKPKSFAGLFASAPSVALATLGLAFTRHGNAYAAVEARSMILGAAGMMVYCRAVVWMSGRRNLPALASALLALPVWFGVSFGLLALLTRGTFR